VVLLQPMDSDLLQGRERFERGESTFNPALEVAADPPPRDSAACSARDGLLLSSSTFFTFSSTVLRRVHLKG